MCASVLVPQLLWTLCLDLFQSKIWRSYIFLIWRWNIITGTDKKVCPNFSFKQKDAENFGIYLILPQFNGYSFPGQLHTGIFKPKILNQFS